MWKRLEYQMTNLEKLKTKVLSQLNDRLTEYSDEEIRGYILDAIIETKKCATELEVSWAIEPIGYLTTWTQDLVLNSEVSDD